MKNAKRYTINQNDVRSSTGSNLIGWTNATLHTIYGDREIGEVMVKRCKHCHSWFVPARSDQKTCSDKCRQAEYRAKHATPKYTDSAARAAAARKGAATKAAQVFDLTCKHCGKPMKRDGNSATATLYCSDACTQAAYRTRKNGGDKRTPRQVMIDDALIALQSGMWNIADDRQITELLNTIAAARSKAVQQYWKATTGSKRRKLIQKICVTHMLAHLNDIERKQQ